MNYDQIRNLPLMFFEQAERQTEQPFLWAKRDGDWRSQTWQETASAALALARGLRKIGLQRGDRVVLVAENRPEWLIADIAIMAAGGITVPAYTTNTVDDHHHVLSDSGAKIAIVSTPALAKNLLPAAADTETETVVFMDPPAPQHAGDGWS